jgi:hypothetical protein
MAPGLGGGPEGTILSADNPLCRAAFAHQEPKELST